MKTHLTVSLILLVLSTTPIRAGLRTLSWDRRQMDTAPGWYSVIPKGEEFSMSTPVQPSVFYGSTGFVYGEGSEEVLKQAGYSGYRDRFVFVVESYLTRNPPRLLIAMQHIFKGLEPVEQGSLGGRYRLNGPRLFGYVRSFLTKNHVYVVKVAANDLGHPSISRFLTSFKITDNKNADSDIAPRRESTIVDPVASVASVLSKETTERAILVWKPEPSYTKRARENQRMGTVILQAIFAASGEVIVTEVIKGLADGLTEQAVEAAKNIKFLPAGKDGQPVAIRIRLEYNFNLY